MQDTTQNQEVQREHRLSLSTGLGSPKAWCGYAFYQQQELRPQQTQLHPVLCSWVGSWLQFGSWHTLTASIMLYCHCWLLYVLLLWLWKQSSRRVRT